MPSWNGTHLGIGSFTFTLQQPVYFPTSFVWLL